MHKPVADHKPVLAVKTYKREVASGLLVILFSLYLLGFWYPEAIEVAEKVKTEIFLFAGGAFGLDAIKQIRRAE